MLASIREYAIERLIAGGELDYLQREHTAYYLHLAEASSGYYLSSETEQRGWLDRLETEHENLRAALRWCEMRGTPEERERLAGALAWFWLNRNHWSEGRYWIDRILASAITQGAEHPAAGALVLQAAGIFALAQGDLPSATSRLQRSVTLWRERGDRRQLAATLAALATVDLRNRDPAALATASESLDLFRALGDHRGVAALQLQLGSIATHAGDLEQARSLLTESRAFWLEAGEQTRVATADARLGELATVEADYTTARVHFERSLAAFRALGEQGGVYRQGLAIVLTHLGELADQEEDYAGAVGYCREALTLARALGDKGTVAATLTALGRVARHQREEQQEVLLFQEALQLRQKQGYTSAMLVCLSELAEGAMHAGQPERAVRLFASAAPHPAPSAAAMDGDLSAYEPARTAQHLATLRAALPPAAFATAWSVGEAWSLDQTVADALNG